MGSFLNIPIVLFKKIFLYLAVLGLSCSLQDLQSLPWCVRFLIIAYGIFFFFFLVAARGGLVVTHGIYLVPRLQIKSGSMHEVLATQPPGKSPIAL